MIAAWLAAVAIMAAGVLAAVCLDRRTRPHGHHHAGRVRLPRHWPEPDLEPLPGWDTGDWDLATLRLFTQMNTVAVHEDQTDVLPAVVLGGDR